MNKKWGFRYSKVIVWSIVIGILCFIPGNELKEIEINIPHFDKIIHFGLFFILGLTIRGLQSEKNHELVINLFMVFYAMIIEVIQHNFVPNRSGDVFDFIFDVLGLLVGVFMFKYLPKFTQRLLST